MPGVVLITGAAGFAGSHLLDSLVGDGQDVVAWHRPGGRVPRTLSAVSWQAIDLLDRAAVQRELGRLRPWLVYHCAGAAHVGHSWEITEPAYAVNVKGTHHVIEGLRDAGVEARVLIPSSAMVYAPSDRPLRETDPLVPSSPYGLSKLAQELIARDPERPQQTSIARSFNHFGPRQDHSFSASAFARRIAEIEATRSEGELKVGNLDARRDLTDVRDTVRAYRCILEQGTPGHAYNVCSGRAIAIRAVLDMLLAQSRVPIRVTVDPARYRPNDLPLIVGDPSRIQRELGWKPMIPMEQTIADLLDFWRAEIAAAVR